MNSEYFQKMFIDEAKAILGTSAGNGGDDGAELKSIVERTITTFYNDKLEKIGSSGMRHCLALTDVMLSNVTELGQYAFYQCSALERADLPKVTTIGNYAFGNCTALNALILGNKETVCKASAATVFTGATIANGAGYIYVPAALVDSYKADSFWSTYAAQIRAIEDYPDICGII